MVEALQRGLTNLFEADVRSAVAEHAHDVGCKDLAGTRHRFEPRGFDDGHAVMVAVVCDHLAGPNPIRTWNAATACSVVP